jgi:serine/threonine protein kinase/Tol biopolymer transport system component/tetratricopeptide (TPR) repeat protein
VTLAIRMTPERRQLIDLLFHAALARDSPQREEFLAVNCAGDQSLRFEVESLISFREHAPDVTETPPRKQVDAHKSEGQNESESGTVQEQISEPANAYQAYQLSRYYFQKVSFPDLSKSRTWLEEAVRLDPHFAPAHASLAEQCVMEAITGLQSPAESFPHAKEALRRASELNMTSAEFYTVAGFVDLICDWNFAAAEQNLRKSLEINSACAFANHYLGHVLMFQGRAVEAGACLQRALEIEPMNLYHGLMLTISYYLARDYQKTIEESERLLAIYPRFVVARSYRCMAWEQQGRAAEAIDEYERILLEPGGEIARRFMGFAYASIGDRGKALKTADKLDAESVAHYLSPTCQAVLYAALNERDKAFSYLQKGLAERDPWMLWSGTDPRLDCLRSDPRFEELLGKIGLKSPSGSHPSQLLPSIESGTLAGRLVKRRHQMTPERWSQINELFHQALACEKTDRQQFLSACCNDDELRVEVESLISSHEADVSFIETGAGDIAAELLGANKSAFKAGEQIGNYTIVRQLGSGGMGIVYLADDIRLKRKVALKLLPAHFTVNPDRVRRFEREARAASALNHPNMVTIYEIGQSNSTHFIATEFVDGKTLRELINEKPFTLSEALNVGIQVGAALAGAHEAGIVHRDIKPENIMVRSDGYVKVLDFGLAKLTEEQTAGSEETPTLLQSNPGLIMGTVQYMSPEQARAKRVDRRTDIWSLGIVLYELLSGHVPFSGDTPSHVMVSLMEDQLPSLADYANVPAELNRIVARALRKNQKERYQNASHLARDLKHLKRKLQAEEHLKRCLQAVPTRKEESRRDAIAAELQPLPVRHTVAVGTAHTTSSPGFQVSKARRPRKVFALGLAISLVLGLAAFGGYRLWLRNRATAQVVPFQTIELTRFTNSGRVNDAAISPDGRYVAYVAANEGKESIWLRELANSNATLIVPPTDVTYYGGTFSSDGKHFYYTSMEHSNSIGVLYRVPVSGGVPVKLIVDVDGPISLSSDDGQIAFVRGASTGERALMIARADGTDERKVASRTGYGAFSFNGPAWSPDGSSIACGAAYVDQSGRYSNLVAVDVKDGSIRQLSTQKWKLMGRIAWLKDGKGLVFTANKIGTPSTSQLWYLPYPNGELQRITRDLQDYHGVTVTSDATTLVSKQTQTISALWIAPNGNADLAKAILSHKADDAYDPFSYSRTRFSWTSNGQIIYTSLVNGNPNIWVMNANGTGHKQLTNDPGDNSFPSVTPDSRYIIFVSNRSGFMNLWRMDSDGGNQKRLTMGEDDSWPWSTPDSRWIVYHSGNQGLRTLWRVSTEGGHPEQLTDYPSLCPVVSPDGQWISFYYRPETKAPWKLAIIPFNGGPPVKTMDIPRDVDFRSLVRWTPDGSSLAYIVNRDGIHNIWVQPLDGRPASQLTNFKSDQIFWFDWSPDGQQLGVSRGTVTSDVVMIKDLHKVGDSQ